MKRTVVLRGGPLDGHMREVGEDMRTAYFPYTPTTPSEFKRLGVEPAAAGFVLVLVYKEVNPGMPVWKYLGVNHAPLREVGT